MAEAELVNSHNPEIQHRLGKTARLLLTSQSRPAAEMSRVASGSIGSIDSQLSSEQPAAPIVSLEASLDEQVLRYEAELIKRALETSEGSITRAARLLGVTHQGLAFILNGRQKDLLPSRKPAKPRRRSIIRFH
jgi:DNA-binding NtrC family response regulator